MLLPSYVERVSVSRKRNIFYELRSAGFKIALYELVFLEISVTTILLDTVREVLIKKVVIDLMTTYN